MLNKEMLMGDARYHKLDAHIIIREIDADYSVPYIMCIPKGRIPYWVNMGNTLPYDSGVSDLSIYRIEDGVERYAVTVGSVERWSYCKPNNGKGQTCYFLNDEGIVITSAHNPNDCGTFDITDVEIDAEVAQAIILGLIANMDIGLYFDPPPDGYIDP